jgi:mono/diheme cytochrome c family protein
LIGKPRVHRPTEPKRSRAARRGFAVLGTFAAVAAVSVAPTGSAQQRSSGEALFTTTYKCYACHGFDAQTGQRRLVPMRYTKEGFIMFVQNSPLPQMPAFADVPDGDLAAIYDYILTIPVDAPEVDDVPLLRDIAERQAEALSP